MDFKTINETLRQKGYSVRSQAALPGSFCVSRYLRRHDIVFNTPMNHGFEGLPIGNGDLAAMVWNTDTGISMQINKNDLWTQPDEEAPSLLRAAAQLSIDFCAPVFHYMYLDNYKARLRLSDECASFASTTPFSTQKIEMFADSNANVIVADIERSCNEDSALRVSLERYGSRGYIRWDSRQTAGARYGLGEACVKQHGNDLVLTERFNEEGLTVTVAVRLSGSEAVPMIVGRRRGEINLPMSGKCHTTLLISVVSTHDGHPDERAALDALDRASIKERRERTDAWWADFWNSSFVHLCRKGQESESDYLENMYYIQQYVLALSSRADYPMIFNAGLCNWNHDYHAWVNPHHWNMQQAYWAVEASNHPEIMKPYLAAYYRIMPQCGEHAKAVFSSEHGLALAEMHDFAGRMLNFKNAITPVQQVAMRFWEHYLYNQDKEYLRTVGYPFIAGCANLYADFARFDPTTGECIVGPVMPMESSSYDNMYNTGVDAAMMRYILPAALQAAEELGIKNEQTERWAYLKEHLFDYPYVHYYTYLRNDNDTIAMGYLPDLKTMITATHGFCRDVCPIMPAGVIGRKDRDTREFKAIVSTMFEQDDGRQGFHNPLSVVWERLGYGDKTFDLLLDGINEFQSYPQGLYLHLGDREWIYDERSVYENCQITQPADVPQRDVCDQYLPESKVIRRVDVPTRPFAQCSFEQSGILMHSYNELALQTYEGVIRVYSAFETGYEGQFTLRAPGGFMVTGFIAPEGRVPLILIRSQYGRPCVVDFAFDDTHVCDEQGNEIPFCRDKDGFIEFDTCAGTGYVLWRDALDPGSIPSFRFEEKINEDMKSCRRARLGDKRNF